MTLCYIQKTLPQTCLHLENDSAATASEIRYLTLTTRFSNYFLQTYYSLVLYLLLAFLICALLGTLAYLFSLSAIHDSEKKSEYECGFEPFDSATRLPFDVHFYLVGILFLIFDVEIALLFPWVLGINVVGWFGFYLRRGFIFILSIGFLYEWKRGALIWPSRQQERVYVKRAIDLNGLLFIALISVCLYFTYPKALNRYRSFFLKRGGVLLKQQSAKRNLSLLTRVVLPAPEQAKFAWENVSVQKRLPYAEQITACLTTELAFRTLLRYVLTALALELGRGRSKSELALQALNALRTGFVLITLAEIIKHAGGSTCFIFNGYLITSAYVTARKILVLLACSFVLRSSVQYVGNHKRHLLEYAVVFSLTTLFRRLLVRSTNRRAAFRAIVGFSLNLYVLILFDAPRGGAREAGVKYYFLSTFSSGLRIYGIFIFFAVVHSLGFFERGQILASDAGLVFSALFSLRVGLALLLNGIFFKLSAFPGHLWAAEVYEGSPDPIVAFFRLPVKIAVLSFLLSILAVATRPLSFAWQPILRVSAVGSLVWGCLGALAEKNTKRFLAYASINQIGFLILGLTTASSEGRMATILYLFVYSLRNFGFLTVFLCARRRTKGGRLFLTDFRSLGQQNWLVSWSAARTLFSRAGIPPLAGFFGKYFLLLHAQQEKLYFLVVTALAVSLISAYYYLRIIKTRWFEGQEKRVPIVCNLSDNQQTLRFSAEGALWSFIIFSGNVVTFATELGEILSGPNVSN